MTQTSMTVHLAWIGASLVVALACACSSTPTRTPIEGDGGGESLGTRKDEDLGAKPALRTLYETQWPSWYVRLIGVDDEASMAWLQLESRDQGNEKLMVDTIDLRTGQRVDRWMATQGNARLYTKRLRLSMVPLSGSFEDDLARLGKIVRRSGPWHYRGGAPLVISPKGAHIVHADVPTDGRDGDWLTIRDGTGRNPRRLDTGLRASYQPVFSPDSTTVAWAGCSDKVSAASVCAYNLYLRDINGGTPRRVRKVPGNVKPVWSVDGERVFAVVRRRTRACLYEVPRDRLSEASSLYCLSGLRDVAFVQSPDGKTGVMAGYSGEPGEQTYVYHWFDLRSGDRLGRARLKRGTGPGTLGPKGLLIAPRQRGAFTIIDLGKDLRRNFDGLNIAQGSYSRSRWYDDSKVIMVSADGRRVRVIELDVAAALANQ